jgi:hypothetical protein
MSKCSNCATDAKYLYKVTPEFGQEYCEVHLPKFLKASKKDLLIPVEKPSKKKADPVVEAPSETPLESPETVQ